MNNLISSTAILCLLLLDHHVDAIVEKKYHFDESTILTEFTTLAEWIRSHEGGFVDHRLVVRGIFGEDNSTMYRGVFTIQDIHEGDQLCFIPWNTILGPGQIDNHEWDASIDETVFHLAHEMEAGQQSFFAPYLNVIRSQQITVPSAWSLPGRTLLQQLVGDLLPPHHLERNVEEFVRKHGMHSRLMTSYYWTMTRSIQADTGNQWLLVPLVDQYNHHSDDRIVNTARFASRGHGFEVRATKFIPAGSELYTQYWGDYTHYFFEEFGFVEGYPRRWMFDVRHVGGSEVVDVRLSQQHSQNATNNNHDDTMLLEWFSGHPSDKVTMDILQQEFVRLQEFQREHLSHYEGNNLISKQENDLIWEYHRAILTALDQVLKSTNIEIQQERITSETCLNYT
jgi:SET domain